MKLLEGTTGLAAIAIVIVSGGYLTYLKYKHRAIFATAKSSSEAFDLIRQTDPRDGFYIKVIEIGLGLATVILGFATFI